MNQIHNSPLEWDLNEYLMYGECHSSFTHKTICSSSCIEIVALGVIVSDLLQGQIFLQFPLSLLYPVANQISKYMYYLFTYITNMMCCLLNCFRRVYH